MRVFNESEAIIAASQAAGKWRMRSSAQDCLIAMSINVLAAFLADLIAPEPRGQERLKEAAKLGFSIAVVPKANAPKKAIEGLAIHAVERIEQAIEVVRAL